MPVFSLKEVSRLCTALGFRSDSDDPLFRVDAGETAVIAKELQFVEAEIYKEEFPDNKARVLIPVKSNIPAWAETFTFRVWGAVGMAKIITDYSDDLPSVDLKAAEHVQRIVTTGDSFEYSVQDLIAAAKLSVPLDTERGVMARRAMDNRFEHIALYGDAETGLPGFTNMPNVPILSAPGTLTGNWLTGATPKEILADMHKMSNEIVNNTLGIHSPTTMVLPLEHYGHVATTTMNEYQDTSILDVFLKQSDSVREVVKWVHLGTAYSGSPLAVTYEKTPAVVGLVIPREFTMQPPQPKNLAFKVPCFARIGGVSWKRPMAACYGIGI